MPASRRILLVDDELHVLAVLSACLVRAGYEVETAENGAEALPLVRSFQPDLLITDYMMDGMDGLELSRRIHDDPDNTKLPIIMITARGHQIPEDQARDCRIGLFLPKPFSPKQVVEAAENLLRHPPGRRATDAA